MEKPYLLHMITAAKNLSPFDVNMAYDAGWTSCIPYTHVTLDEVPGLTQDAIFSRGPKGVARTGIFLGGRDIHLALDMLAQARASMVPPFEVSVCADPSGAFTTAAAMVASAESWLARGHGLALAGQRVLVLGSGPVGKAVAILTSRAGAETRLSSHSGRAPAQAVADECNRRYGVAIDGADGSSDASLRALLADVGLVFNAAAAGVQVLAAGTIAAAGRLRIACDVNAVPPAGIEGIGVMDDGVPVPASTSGALGLGALAVGNIKYRVQQRLLRQMHEAGTPQFLGLDEALAVARQHVA